MSNKNDIKPAMVSRSMANNFTDEINDRANWHWSYNGRTMEISGQINGETYRHETPDTEIMGKTPVGNGVSEAIRRATKYFQGIIADSKVDEPEDVVAEIPEVIEEESTVVEEIEEPIVIAPKARSKGRKK